MSTAVAAPEHKPNWLKQYFLDFKVLGDNPFAFWVVQFINLLDSLGYFALLGVGTLFLNQTIGMDKVMTGYTFTAFTTLITLSLFVAGAVTDSLGINKSLGIAQGIALVTRTVIAICGLSPDIPGRGWIVAAALVISAPGAAMTQTVFQAANKRYSSRKSRSASFNIWYLIMNIGAMAGGLAIDVVRVDLGVSLSWIFVMAAAAAGINVVVTLLFVRNTATVLEEGEEPEAAADPNSPKKGGMQILREVVRESAFWRFIVLMVAVLGVRAVFSYMYLLMPQYWVEVIEQTGSAKTDQGLLQAINPVLIVGGLILFIPIANRFNVFKMLISGAFISAASLLVLVLPWQWFGPTMAQGYFAMAVVMLTVLSIGELAWSPKLTEYTAAIAPHGQEGTYLGLSMMPWFVAKLAVSAMSGHMLERWVPEGRGLQTMCSADVAFWDTPEAMWGVLFLWAFVGPAVALFLKGWLTAGADLDPAVKPTPESSRRFRMQAGIFALVFMAACSAFFYKNAAVQAAPVNGPDGKPLPPAVRTAKEAQTCGCYFADKSSLGAKLCKEAQPVALKEEKAQKDYRKQCLTEWFVDPVAKCAALCKSLPANDKAGTTAEKAQGDCQAKCGAMAQAPKVAADQAGYCAGRVLDLE